MKFRRTFVVLILGLGLTLALLWMLDFAPAPSARALPTSCNLSLVKTVSPARAAPGDNITYTLIFSNAGGDLAADVVITDRVPPSVTHASLTVDSNLDITLTGGISYAWEVEDLAQDEGGIITITGQLSDALTVGTFTNTAVISSSSDDGNVANNSSSAVLRVSSLIISEIMYNPASKEDDWEWIEIYNAGATAVDLSGYVVDDSNSNDHDEANIATGSIGPGQTAVLFNADDVSVADFEAAWGTSLNLVSVTHWSAMGLNNSGDGDRIGLWASFADYSGDHQNHNNVIEGVNYDDSGDWPSDNDKASIYLTDLNANNNEGSNWELSTIDGATPTFTGYQSRSAGGNSGADVGSPGPIADLSIAKTVIPTKANPGDSFTYTLTFSNAGRGTARGVVITDLIPLSLTVQTIISSGVEITDTSTPPTYVWEVADLAQNEGGCITITGTLSRSLHEHGGQTIVNTAEIATSSIDGESANDSDDAEIEVTNARLELVKRVSEKTPDPGEIILYTITITNHGPDDATGVVISDTLPLSLTNVSSSATQGGYVNGVWDVGDLGADPTSSATLLITGTVNAPDEASITNTAVISTSDQGDSEFADRDDRDTVVIAVRGADVALEKTVDDCTPREGLTVTYAITVTNSGYTSTLVVTDLLPSGVSYVSDDSGGEYDDNNGAWNVGELVQNQSATLHITATVDTGEAGATITNTAAISESSRVDPDQEDDRAEAIVHVQAEDAVIVTLKPADPATLIYTDGQGLTATLAAPAHAVTDPVTLIYTPITTPTQPLPSGLRFAGWAFEFEVYLDGVLQPGYAFTRPVTVTLHYSDEAVAGLDEAGLILEYWNEEAGVWEEAACGDYERHAEDNWLAVPICHLTPFALLGRSVPIGGATELMSGPLWPTMFMSCSAFVIVLAFAALKRRLA